MYHFFNQVVPHTHSRDKKKKKKHLHEIINLPSLKKFKFPVSPGISSYFYLENGHHERDFGRGS